MGLMIILRGWLFVLFLIFCRFEGCGGLPVLRLAPAATTRPPLGPLALVTCSTGPFGGPHLRFGGFDSAVVFLGRWVAFFFAISAALLSRTARRAAMRKSCYLVSTLLRRSVVGFAPADTP